MYNNNRPATPEELQKGLLRAYDLVEYAANSNIKVKKVIVQNAEPQLIYAHDD